LAILACNALILFLILENILADAIISSQTIKNPSATQIPRKVIISPYLDRMIG